MGRFWVVEYQVSNSSRQVRPYQTSHEARCSSERTRAPGQCSVTPRCLRTQSAVEWPCQYEKSYTCRKVGVPQGVERRSSS